MKIQSVDLAISAVRRSQFPTDKKSEFLLIGRSNVGKSSFINTLINRKNYARTSGRPGKTQTINFYSVNDEFYLVDVPGYGYAGVSKTKRQNFGLMIEDYIVNRPNLKQVFLLIDFRHKVSNDDVLMYEYLKYYKIPVTIIATKVDKIGVTSHQKHKKMLSESLGLTEDDDLIMFSSMSKIGKEEILKKIENLV